MNRTAGPAATPERLFLVSDLHLDVVDSPGRNDARYAEAFAAFVDGLGGTTGDGTRTRLVVLGDFFELRRRRRDAGAEQSPERMRQLLARHGTVLDALARFLDRGGRLDLVVGNHDLDLGRLDVVPELRRDLIRRSGAALEPGSFAVHRWLLYLPGVLYAEHGHQYHDINTVAHILTPWGPGDGGPPPALLSDAIGERSPLVSGLRLLAGLVMSSSPARVRERREYRRSVLPSFAVECGLPVDVLAALDELAETSARSVLWRLARQGAMAGGRGAVSPDAYLQTAVDRISQILSSSGHAVPCYAFGHTHRAARRALTVGPSPALYINTGTWSSSVRRQENSEAFPLPTYVDITVAPAAPPQVSVRTFQPGQLRPYAGAASPGRLGGVPR